MQEYSKEKKYMYLYIRIYVHNMNKKRSVLAIQYISLSDIFVCHAVEPRWCVPIHTFHAFEVKKISRKWDHRMYKKDGGRDECKRRELVGYGKKRDEYERTRGWERTKRASPSPGIPSSRYIYKIIRRLWETTPTTPTLIQWDSTAFESQPSRCIVELFYYYLPTATTGRIQWGARSEGRGLFIPAGKNPGQCIALAIFIFAHTRVYMYIYMSVCVCVQLTSGICLANPLFLLDPTPGWAAIGRRSTRLYPSSIEHQPPKELAIPVTLSCSVEFSFLYALWYQYLSYFSPFMPVLNRFLVSFLSRVTHDPNFYKDPSL